MSGIAGVFARDGRPVEAHELKPMLDRLAHRGPDGSARWAEGAVALGHQTLWNTPEAVHETLPLVEKEGPFAITADARIDNRDELIAALGMSDRPAREIGDAELILRAYQHWGAACPEHLVGDFAFAIWDGPQQRLFCARDHLGAKPFVYHLTDVLFVCASGAGAVMAHTAVTKRLNEVRIADFLVPSLDGIDKTSTFFEGVLRLPPAHRLIVARDSHRIERYWTLDPTREIRLDSDAEYEETFLHLLTEAVRCRLRSHRPVGLALSGGIDSVSIAGVATRVLNHAPLLTFSATNPADSGCVDTRSIERVIRAGDFEAYRCTPADLDRRWEGMTAYASRVDTPADIPITGMGVALTADVRARGVGTLLDGFDGDALLGTNKVLIAELLRRGRWKQAWQEAQAFAAPFEVSARRMWWGYGFRSLLGDFMPAAVRRVRQRLGHRQSVEAALAESLISPDLAQRVDMPARLRWAWESQHEFEHRGMRTQHANRILHPYVASELESGERGAARSRFEVRTPLFDRRLLEFSLALPPEQKMREGIRKWLLRRAVREFVPEEVVKRVDFPYDLGPAFAARAMALEHDRFLSLERDASLVESYVDVRKLNAALRIHEARLAIPDGFGFPWESTAVLKAVGLGLWARYQSDSME